MTRKESEKDAERPHYYSQFWLDVAAGRRIIGAPKPNEDGELVDTEVSDSSEVSELPEVLTPRRPVRVSEQESSNHTRATADRYAENLKAPVIEPVVEEEEESEPEEADLVTNAIEEVDQNTAVEDADIPDVDLSPAEEEEEFFDEEDEEEASEEEEDEDDDSWTRGRKKAKPVRPVKPAPKRPAGGKREPRRF